MFVIPAGFLPICSSSYTGLEPSDLQDYSPWSPGEEAEYIRKVLPWAQHCQASVLFLLFSVRPLEANFRSPRMRKQGQHVPSFPPLPYFPLSSSLPCAPLYPLQPLSPAFLSPHPSFSSPLSISLDHLSCDPVRGCSGLGKAVAETRKGCNFRDHLSRKSDGARGAWGGTQKCLWISCSLLGLPLSPGFCLLSMLGSPDSQHF